jgi:hypothetical protein
MNTMDVPAEFDEACDVLKTILDKIKCDDSYRRDPNFEEVVFDKYAELRTLYEYVINANDKALIKKHVFRVEASSDELPALSKTALCLVARMERRVSSKSRVP